jgi:integrase/recombinase XerD
LKKQLDDFLSVLIQERGLSENTIEAYRGDLYQYLDFLIKNTDCTIWTDVTDLTVMKYLYYLKDQGNAASTLARKAAAVRGFHRHLLRSHQVNHDPSFSMDLPKVEKKPLPSMLTVKQTEQLLAAPDTQTALGRRDKAMMEVLYATGMRVSECIHLNREDLSLELEFIRCVGKKGSERILPLNQPAIQALESYLSLSDEPKESHLGQPLFMNRLDNRLTRQGIWKIIKHYAELADISIQMSPETLRHSLTAHLLQNGADLEFVDELMGRANNSAAMRYPRPNRLPLKEVYARFHPRAHS